jgi:hypothetical protein
MSGVRFIALTGGPGGGKTTLIEELGNDSNYASHLLFLPESIFVAGSMGISPQEKQFQRIMVQTQFGLEDSLTQAENQDNKRLVLCHRGSLDPLAYWLARGWDENEFFTFTGTHREDHLLRYVAVIHLVTAADGAQHAYKRWPEAHRIEQPQDAINLDRLLGKIWQGHPRYYRLDNRGISWDEKSRKAKEIIQQFL